MPEPDEQIELTGGGRTTVDRRGQVVLDVTGHPPRTPFSGTSIVSTYRGLAEEWDVLVY